MQNVALFANSSCQDEGMNNRRNLVAKRNICLQHSFLSSDGVQAVNSSFIGLSIERLYDTRVSFFHGSKRAFFLLTTFILFIQAAVFAQNVSISGKDLTLRQVFTAIEKQTGYSILYKKEDVNESRTISVAAVGMPLKEFLDLVFKDQQTKYTIRDMTILLSRKTPSTSINSTKSGSPDQVNPPVKLLIMNTSGIRLAGATVKVKNKTSSGISDAEGRINLNLEAGDELLVSYLGYETRSIVVDAALINNGAFTVMLQPDVARLNEISIKVNTGYQRIRPEQSTGAVARIATKDYESRVSTDFLSGLVNRVPGLMINNDVKFNSNANGLQSSNNLFNVRGISTMTGNQNPLIVVDGYPTELTLNMINPNEIESVTVLKDAAAATVYGVRASNGVIVIERKQAAIGKPRFNFRVTSGISPEEDYTRYRWDKDASGVNIAYNLDRYKTAINASSWSQLRIPRGIAYSPVYYLMAQQAASVITPYQAEMKFQEMKGYNNAADYSRLFLRPATTQTYNLDISGGNTGALYYITANYTRNKLSQINNDNGRFQLSVRTNLNLSKRLSLELQTDYLEERKNAAPVPDINSIYPYEHLQDDAGNPMPIFSQSRINPYYSDVLVTKGLLNQLYYPLIDVEEINDKTKTINSRSSANFIYKLGRGFNLRFGGVYENSQSDIRHYASEKSSQARQYVNSYVQQDASGNLIFNIPQGGFLQQQTAGTSSYTLRAQLNYDKYLSKDHSLNGIIGAEVRGVTDKMSSAAYFGYNDQTLMQQPVNFSSIATGFLSPFVSMLRIDYNQLFNQQYADNRYISGYSNIVYSFRNTYSLTASARIDQSNLFGTNPKYRYKPLWSVGAAWNIHKEDFMQGLDWLRQLKLRVAKGFNGNVAKMSLPQVIAQSVQNQLTTPVSTALTRYAFANSGLRWEQSNNFNIGLDFGLFKNVNGSVDYYTKKSSDLLANAQIDPTIGPGPTLINTASINNKGLEIGLHADWISKDKFNWNTGLVFAKNTSKVLKVYQDLAFSPTVLNGAGYLEGYPLGSLFAYRWAGIDKTGIPQVSDSKGTIYSTTSVDGYNAMNSSTSGTVMYMGSSIPTINAGLSNRVDIGNFYVYCMISYYGGFKVMTPRPNPNTFRPLVGSGNYWKQPGDELHSDIMSLQAFSLSNSVFAYNYADINVVNGDYLTLADLSVSYNLGSREIFKRAGFSAFEIKLQASNLYTIGLNKFNYSMATGSYAKSYLTPTYTFALFTNF